MVTLNQSGPLEDNAQTLKRSDEVTMRELNLHLRVSVCASMIEMWSVGSYHNCHRNGRLSSVQCVMHQLEEEEEEEEEEEKGEDNKNERERELVSWFGDNLPL